MDSVGYIILYVIVALSIIVFSFLAVKTRRILRAATYLLFALIATAVVYFQLGYEFLGAVQIAVYAGGIMVLFVFAILLTSKPADKAPAIASHRKFAGICASVIGTVVLLWALVHMPVSADTNLLSMVMEGTTPDMREIGYAMVGTEKFQYLLPFEAVSILLLACIIGGVTVARKR